MLCRPLAFLLALAAAPPLAAAERDVRLTAPDGRLTVEGELLGIEGEFFRVLTADGAVTVDAGGLDCDGPGCPAGEEMQVTAAIAGPPDLLTELLAPLMAGFAEAQGLAFSQTFRADERFTWDLTEPATGRAVARFDLGEILAAPDLVVSRIADDPGLLADIIALDAMVAVVAPDNPVATMSTPTLRLMLEGRVAAWPTQLTGLAETRSVTLHLPDDLSAFGRIWPYRPLAPATTATRHADPNALADAVAADPGALGVVPLSRIGNATPLVLAGPCGRVLPATPMLVKAEDYPLTQPVYIERANALQPRLVRDFIAYAQSPAAQAIIRRTGLVDQAIGRIPFSDQGDRLASAILAAEDDEAAGAEMRRMIRAVAAGERLTLTFRFEDGEAQLDAPSRSNIRQLADAILSGDFKDSELLFAGFTDSQGPAEANLRLSLRRAESVADAVARLIGDSDQRIALDGFGEALPMACDDTHWGREINRRVEVWVRSPRGPAN